MARLGAGAVLVGLATAYWWMPRALRPLTFFGVRRVEVSGTRYLSADAVVRGLALPGDASVFDDLHRLEQRLESLSGVAQARITRHLPATLAVEVVEVEPVALAEGPDGLVALARDARPLPYDLVASPVDAPIVRTADASLLGALATVQASDLGLYGDVAAAHAGAREVVLDLARGQVRLGTPVDPDVVRSVSSVRRDLDARGTAWHEIDGRYRGWIVVRRLDGLTAGRLDGLTTPTQRASTAARPTQRPSSRH